MLYRVFAVRLKEIGSNISRLQVMTADSIEEIKKDLDKEYNIEDINEINVNKKRVYIDVELK